MYRIPFGFPFSLITVFLIWTSPLKADLQLNADYLLEMSVANLQDEEALSGLNLGLSSQSRTSKTNLSADLDLALFYEHISDQSNTQVNGLVSSAYNFSRSSSWILNGQFNEIIEEGDTEIDELSSQTLATITTGPRVRYSHSMRGWVDVELLKIVSEYSDSDLDSEQDRFIVSYYLPLSDSDNIITSLSISSIEYPGNSVSSDYDDEVLRIEYNKSLARLRYSLFIEYNNVELESGIKSEEEAYGYEMVYQLNSYSQLSYELSDNVSNSQQINSDLTFTENAIFLSTVLKNKRHAITYNYQRQNFSFSTTLFRNDFKNLNGFTSFKGKQSGLELQLNQQINPRFNFAIDYSYSEDEFSPPSEKFRENDTSVEFFYLISNSRKITNNISLEFEKIETDDVSNDDVILTYTLDVNLY